MISIGWQKLSDDYEIGMKQSTLDNERPKELQPSEWFQEKKRGSWLNGVIDERRLQPHLIP